MWNHQNYAFCICVTFEIHLLSFVHEDTFHSYQNSENAAQNELSCF